MSIIRSGLEQSTLTEPEKELIRDYVYILDSEIVCNNRCVGLTNEEVYLPDTYPWLTLEGEERVKDILLKFALALKGLNHGQAESGTSETKPARDCC